MAETTTTPRPPRRPSARMVRRWWVAAHPRGPTCCSPSRSRRARERQRAPRAELGRPTGLPDFRGVASPRAARSLWHALRVEGSARAQSLIVLFEKSFGSTLLHLPQGRMMKESQGPLWVFISGVPQAWSAPLGAEASTAAACQAA
jgi:hypothetical protein